MTQILDTKKVNLPYSVPALNTLEFFEKSVAFSNPLLKERLNGTILDQAYFLYNHAIEYSWQFLVQLNRYLKHQTNIRKITGNVKSNLVRISSNIVTEGSCFKVKDMIRATIVTKSINDIIDVYQQLEEISLIKIVDIKNNLSQLNQNVVLNFVWKDNNEYYNEEKGIEQGTSHESIIGEIVIRFRNKKAHYYAN